VDRAGLLKSALRGVALPAGAILLVAGVVFSFGAAETGLSYRDAIVLRGVVTGKERVRADRERNPSTRFVARYRLVVPGGETIEAEDDLPRKLWEARAVGDEVPLRYLARERRTLPGSGAELEGAIIMGALGAILFVAGLLLAREPVGRIIALMRLIGRGSAGTATVTGVFETSTSTRQMIFWRLRYRYRDARGVEHEGESDLLAPDEAGAWQAGATGPILYDPARPAASAWLGRYAAQPDPAAPGIGARMWTGLMDLARWVIRIALVLAAIFVAGVIGELTPPLKALEAWMTDQRLQLMYATGGAAVLGLFVMLGGIISLIMKRGEPLDHTGVENVNRSVRDGQMGQRIWRTSTYRIFGVGQGASADDAFSFAELKGAFRSGAILSQGIWRTRLCALLGATLMFCGIFGVAIVLTPLALKLLLAAVVLYAVVRTAWGLIRA
jgi:uncharacterized protein DUF3592